MIRTLALTVLLALSLSLGATTPQASAGTQAASELDNQLDKPEITYGAQVTVSTTLTVNSAVIANATVSLMRREYPATEFSLVGSVLTNGQGEASFTLKPAKKTNYKWVFAGNETAGPSESAWKTVKVHTKVNMHLKDQTISPGQRAVLIGNTLPAKPGATATVYRITIGGDTSKWFSGQVASDGTFRLAKRVPTGLKYRVYVVVAAHSGNLKGTSPTHDLYVA